MIQGSGPGPGSQPSPEDLAVIQGPRQALSSCIVARECEILNTNAGSQPGPEDKAVIQGPVPSLGSQDFVVSPVDKL